MDDTINQNFRVNTKYAFNKATEFKNEDPEHTRIYSTHEFESDTLATSTSTTTTTTLATILTPLITTSSLTLDTTSTTSTLLDGESVSKRLREVIETSVPINMNLVMDVVIHQEEVTKEKSRVIEEKEREIERMREAMENQRRDLERDLQNQREENERLVYENKRLRVKEHANKPFAATHRERQVYFVFDKPNITHHYKPFIKWLDEFFSSEKMDLKELDISDEMSTFPLSIEKREKHNNDNLLPLVLYIITPGSIRIEHEMNMKKYNDISLKTQSIVLFVLRYGANKSAFSKVELPPNLTTGINTHPEISSYGFTKHGFLSAIFYKDMIVDSEDCIRDLESLLGIKQRKVGCAVM